MIVDSVLALLKVKYFLSKSWKKTKTLYCLQ